LKPRGYLKQTIASASKVYQPQSNTKVLFETLTSEEGFTKVFFRETSTGRIEAETLKLKLGFTDSTPIRSLVYTSCKSEEPSPHFPVPSFSYFLSPKPFSLNPERSLHFLENAPCNLKVLSPRLSMVAPDMKV
jgi:hypothetical protein